MRTGPRGLAFAAHVALAPLQRTRIIRITIAALIFLGAAPALNFRAWAEGYDGRRQIDISAVTCGEFGRLNLPQALILVGWIGGFYAGLRNDTHVDASRFVEKVEHIILLCQENESTRLLDVAKHELEVPDQPERAPLPSSRGGVQ